MSVVSDGAAMASIGKSARRRAIVFCAVFLPAVTASLVYVFTRPPEYRAVARLQISPASVVTQPSDAKDAPTVATDAKSFLTEVQTLTSRPLLQDVLDRLKGDGGLPDLGPDPVASVQQMLHAEPIEGTQIVQLAAVGPQPEFGPRLVNTVALAYRQHVADAYKSLAASTTGEVGDEIRALDKEVTGKRQAINAFRDRYDIVSMEHKENDVLADIEGLSESYTDANEKLAKAQGHLQALRSSIAAGKAVFRAKDDPTLADLQQRVSVAREQWHDMQRRFTPDYLAMDADAKSLRARLDNLEDQLKSQHGAGERAALAAGAGGCVLRPGRGRPAAQKRRRQPEAGAGICDASQRIQDDARRPRPSRRDAPGRTRPSRQIAGERARAGAARRALGGCRAEQRAVAPRLPARCADRGRRVARARPLRGVVRRFYRRARAVAGGSGAAPAFLGAGLARPRTDAAEPAFGAPRSVFSLLLNGRRGSFPIARSGRSSRPRPRMRGSPWSGF